MWYCRMGLGRWVSRDAVEQYQSLACAHLPNGTNLSPLRVFGVHKQVRPL